MESNLSCLSSLEGEAEHIYIQPHYKESYRLAIYALLCGGREAYDAFLRAEHISHFLSEEEITFILEKAQPPEVEEESEQRRAAGEASASTYLPTESDEEVPDLELGWPGVDTSDTDTSISLLFHPPRRDTPTIKEVVRKHVQHAKQLIAVSMDVFTDVDIFKEMVSATLRGVVVYILLDQSHFSSFYNMSHKVGVNIQDLKNMRVRTVEGLQYQCQSGMRFHGGLEQKFLLVDCSTVLYGSYSYTWAYEKLNRSMVLVVTGQLLWSYDEEFRRLFALSTVPALLSRDHTPGMRPAQDNAAAVARGVGMQSHSPGVGGLLRGYSYGGDSMSRLKMGTKNIGSPLPFGRGVSNMRGDGDSAAATRLPQQIRHLKRYGADQNMIPFNSEMSLHRWKMDAYLNGGETSPVTSPYNSHTGLNEYPSQLIHSRSRDIKSRMEERRQKRLSLQELVHLRRSQESLRSMYLPLERPLHMSSLRSLDTRHNGAEFETHLNQGPRRESTRREAAATYGHTTLEAYDWREPADLDVKLDDPSLKLSYLQSSSLSLQHPRAMESLTEVPEEKEASNTSGHKTKGPLSHGASSLGSAAQRERTKPGSSDTGHRKYTDSCQPAKETKSPDAQQEEAKIQRKNSMKKKVQAMFSSDERKASKKEEPSPQRKASIKSQGPSGSNPTQASVNGQQDSGTAEAEKPKSPFPKLASYRSSKRKTNLAAEQDHSSRSSLDGEVTAFGAYEFLLSGDKGSSLKRHDSGYRTHSGSDRKLGRFMQRMGNLMSKSKQN